jgi:hypothetical protein
VKQSENPDESPWNFSRKIPKIKVKPLDQGKWKRFWAAGKVEPEKPTGWI